MKRIFILSFAALLLLGLAHAAEDFSVARALVASNASCSNLTDAQLEQIGDYYMELMHPGATHESMDQMMGGEGSASLDSMHIQMARVLYCGETDTPLTYGGMMGMMPGAYQYGQGMMGGYGMMGYGGYGMGYGPGMMGYYNVSNQSGQQYYGMMGYGPGYGMMGYGPGYQNASNATEPRYDGMGYGPGYGGMAGSGYGTGMAGFGAGGLGLIAWGLFWLLGIVLLGLLIIWLYGQIKGGRPSDAREILKQRYARGELTKKQYEEMRNDIS